MDMNKCPKCEGFLTVTDNGYGNCATCRLNFTPVIMQLVQELVVERDALRKELQSENECHSYTQKLLAGTIVKDKLAVDGITVKYEYDMNCTVPAIYFEWDKLDSPVK